MHAARGDASSRQLLLGTRPPPLDTTPLSGVGGMGSRASPVQSLAGLTLGVVTLVNIRIERPLLTKKMSAAAEWHLRSMHTCEVALSESNASCCRYVCVMGVEIPC